MSRRNGSNSDGKQVVRDPKTGREVWRMTHSETHDVHTYYDINSWNPQGTRIAFSAIGPRDVLLEKTQRTGKGMLCVMNSDGTGRECLVGETDFSVHTGCLPIWSISGREICFLAENQTCIIDLESRRTRKIEGLTGRALSPDGRYLACQYGPGEERRGVVRVDMNDLSREEIVSAEAMTEMLLEEFNRAARMPDIDAGRMDVVQVANIKWSPDGEKLMLRFNYGVEEYMKSIFVFRPDGSGLRRLGLVSPYFGHHSWHPDGEQILYCDRNEDGGGQVYYLADCRGLGRRPLSSEPLGSHPLLNPAGTEIVDFGGGYILHLDLATGRSERLASYTSNLHKGLHPHPSWSPDGSKVIYHSDHTGTSQIYVIPLH